MSKLSIIPQLKIEDRYNCSLSISLSDSHSHKYHQGKMEIPRKQRFLKLKADWKNRFFVALSNRQVLVFNNAGLEEYEATFSMTRYREVSRKKDETGRQYLVCVVNEKNSDDDLSSMKSADSRETTPHHHKKIPYSAYHQNQMRSTFRLIRGTILFVVLLRT